MLVLARNPDQSVMVGDDIEVMVVGVRGDKVKLGFTAPDNVAVHRKEVWLAIQREKRASEPDGGNASK
jgi:carbon storage regulator